MSSSFDLCRGAQSLLALGRGAVAALVQSGRDSPFSLDYPACAILTAGKARFLWLCRAYSSQRYRGNLSVSYSSKSLSSLFWSLMSAGGGGHHTQ